MASGMAAVSTVTPVENWVGDVARWFGFVADAKFEAFPLIVQAVLAALAALLAYILIHAGQKRAADETRRIERAKLLHELDREYYDLMATPCVVRVRGKPPAHIAPTDMLNLEFALTRAVTWRPTVELDANGKSRKYHYINGARHVRITPDYCIDTMTLHRVLGWSKRVGSALTARIVDPCDVADMWRNILPWTTRNRFAYMAEFFGVTDAVKGDPAKMRNWRRRGFEGPLHAVAEVWRGLGTELGERRDRMRTLRKRTPPSWSDIAPLLLLVRTVIDVAVRERRMEPLNFVGLDEGPGAAGDIWIDAKLHAVLFHVPQPATDAG